MSDIDNNNNTLIIVCSCIVVIIIAIIISWFIYKNKFASNEPRVYSECNFKGQTSKIEQMDGNDGKFLSQGVITTNPGSRNSDDLVNIRSFILPYKKMAKGMYIKDRKEIFVASYTTDQPCVTDTINFLIVAEPDILSKVRI